MAGGLMRYRTLSRTSAHRQALLRNLVTSLVKNETITTTYPKAKEAQRLAEKLITLAKKNNETSRRLAMGILYTPHDLIDKVFGELRERYADRPGGYTRVLRTEPKKDWDQAPSAILELVDGPMDVRFAMTAAAVARDRELGRAHSELTRRNVGKVTRYRKGGREEFDRMVELTAELGLADAARDLRLVDLDTEKPAKERPLVGDFRTVYNPRETRRRASVA
ncbi:hypothetical protein GGTG_12180 [Gaeumannomyces tritici R3-111a-1]|uniref:Large ribosomal subunit protein bL17m n=1 Tax=Gaeumannomyces tritici (strain R3-111a-1) TaxID=644352 RepID=J3PFA1_GAET3|nr:hypothetical protein GGTG_12180 [Gaeumannomyces tritici R3-111a-1]EJT70003.1 hypothetical protein GGTG_12180 [Gaeumannomyces tritici R3-111a-1]